jgi:hypothetical protein
MIQEHDDLVVDVNKELQNIVAEEQTIDAGLETLDSSADVSSTAEPSIDLPESSFWDEEANEKASSNSDETSDADKPTSNPSTAGTIKYKANGKEVEISLDEAKKQLSLVAGARRAFTEKQKIQKQYEALQQEHQQLLKIKEAWDKLEDLKHDPERLAEVIFDKPYADIEKEIYERRRLYEEASPEERQLLEYEARMRNLERDMERRNREAERKRQEAEAREYSANLTKLEAEMQRAFFKHKVVDTQDPNVANKLRKMLWRQSVADLKEYAKRLPEGKLPGPKLIAKVFDDNARAIAGFKSEIVNKELKQAVEQKKQAATQKAQLSSTANYSNSIDPNLLKLDPLTLFNKLRGRK